MLCKSQYAREETFGGFHTGSMQEVLLLALKNLPKGPSAGFLLS